MAHSTERIPSLRERTPEGRPPAGSPGPDADPRGRLEGADARLRSARRSPLRPTYDDPVPVFGVSANVGNADDKTEAMASARPPYDAVVAASGSAINDYIERTFGRFVGDRASDEPPLTPWTSMPQSALDRLQSHLSDYYEMEVRSVAPLDCGVVRVDRRDKVRWIARVFPPARSAAATEADIDVLRWLAAHDMPAERLAHDEPLTWLDGHAVVVTEFAPGKPISQTRATSEWMGETLGRLHALPLHDAPDREGGGWHHLSLNGGGRT